MKHSKIIIAMLAVLKAGGAGYVLKSTVDTELLDAIRTVADGGAPTVSCNNISVTTDANGQATITTSQALQNYQDNCTGAPASLSLSTSTFNYNYTCQQNGQVETEMVTLTATDGNVAAAYLDIAARNDGVFPEAQVMSVIDGYRGEMAAAEREKELIPL